MAHDDPYAGKKIGATWAYGLSKVVPEYNPALTATTTDPTLGDDGSITGWYHQSGHLITGGVLVHFDDGATPGSATAGSGDYLISLPFDVDSSVLTVATIAGGASHVGSGFIRDDSTSANSVGVFVYLRLDDPTLIGMRISGTTSGVDASNPFTWDSGDRISVFFTYVADPSAL